MKFDHSYADMTVTELTNLAAKEYEQLLEDKKAGEGQMNAVDGQNPEEQAFLA